ncbi:MAG: hypothetical protein II280_03545, partial [Lachnospiraceae bacterium]|nr:hypothetical protein [Lachnospiraceae bacterium]
MYRPSPYEGLQTLFAEGKKLSDKERLAFAYGPLLSWYREHKRALPWRENKDAYRIWISEIMLQQTRVEAVKPYFFRTETASAVTCFTYGKNTAFVVDNIHSDDFVI